MKKDLSKCLTKDCSDSEVRTYFYALILVNDQVPAYLHNRPALDHFWAIRPDSHLTISIFAWYLPLKDWNLYYVFAHLLAIWPFLSLFDLTHTRPFAICIDLYSTNLVSVHSLVMILVLTRNQKLHGPLSVTFWKALWKTLYLWRIWPSSVSLIFTSTI